MNKMKSSKQISNDTTTPNEKVLKKMSKLEKKLKELEVAIAEWDAKDVDWEREDDNNSTHLVKTRMVNRFMRYWKMYRLLQKESCVNTGRPIHKKIPTENVTRFPEINEAIFRGLNKQISKDTYYFPDYQEVLETVDNVRKDKNLILQENEVRQMAKDLFERIVLILKKRRRKDFIVALPKEVIEDPAEEDQDLAHKLDENKTKGRKEADVIREYVELQVDASAVVINENSASSDESDDESEGEQGIDGEDDGNDSDVQVVSNGENSKKPDIEVLSLSDDEAMCNSNNENGKDSDIEIISLSDDDSK